MSAPSARVGSRRRTDRDALDDATARYRRAERAVSWTLALLAAGAVLAAVTALSLWPGVAVGGLLLLALRAPAFRRRGTARLRTDAPPATVVHEFASGRPPILAFQWAVADEVREVDDGPTDAADEDASGTAATYEFSYLLGLKTVELDLSVDASDGDALGGAVDAGESERRPVATVEIEGTAGGKPWASYAVAVREAADGGSVVDVELRPTRRFDLRRLPQGRVAERYYADVLAAQGYEVVERSVSMTR